jgi:hypothetical protein
MGPEMDTPNTKWRSEVARKKSLVWRFAGPPGTLGDILVTVLGGRIDFGKEHRQDSNLKHAIGA